MTSRQNLCHQQFLRIGPLHSGPTIKINARVPYYRDETKTRIAFGVLEDQEFKLDITVSDMYKSLTDVRYDWGHPVVRLYDNKLDPKKRPYNPYGTYLAFNAPLQYYKDNGVLMDGSWIVVKQER